MHWYNASLWCSSSLTTTSKLVGICKCITCTLQSQVKSGVHQNFSQKNNCEYKLMLLCCNVCSSVRGNVRIGIDANASKAHKFRYRSNRAFKINLGLLKLQYEPSVANISEIYICCRLWSRGWTLHWKLKWHAWVTMKLKPPIYEKFMEKNKFIRRNNMLWNGLMYSY